MSGRISVSIVIPSRGRPYLIPGLLQSLRYLTYPAFEVILIGEYADIAPYEIPEPLRDCIHYFPCFEPNISAARNIGIRAARGEVIAFIDDDAVPEPDWLDLLTAPFDDDRVGIAAGRVRDRDGVRFQFTGARFNAVAEEDPLEDADRAQLFPPAPAHPVAVMGTNCAFRRAALTAAGGFDESYHYYLDETDMVLRLVQAGWWTGWVPEAEVHHHSDQNGMRGKNREPRDPFQLGASKSYFGLRHAPPAERGPAIDRFVDRRRRDLDHHIQIGRITGADRQFMEHRLEAGLEDGETRRPRLPLIASKRERVILPFAERLPASRLSLALVAGWGVSNALRIDHLARALLARGHRITMINLQDGNHPLKVTPLDGLWAHTGGTWPMAQGGRLGALIDSVRGRRAMGEIRRVAPRRGFDAVLRPSTWSLGFNCPSQHRVSCRDDRLGLTLEAPDGTAAESCLIARVEAEIAAALDQIPFDPAAEPWRGTTVRTPRGSATVSPG
ncbi:MAG: glycosyltransferase [Pseudomonadota bacterium]